jgi:acyl-CoA reductase-like NAD-dependent aldehyde dehydrogenase
MTPRWNWAAKARFMVFDDEDIEMAVKGATASKYRNAGQTCGVRQPHPGARRRL